MKRVIALAMLMALLQGCATRFDLQGAAAGSAGPGLRFQTSSVAPQGDEAALRQEILEPGDIILTSAPTLRSVGIRLFTLSSVSHAVLYVGDGRIVEALGSGVHERPLDELLLEENVALVLRYPGLTRDQQLEIMDYALQKTGAGFSFVGATLHVPFSVTRRVCELPLVPEAIRDACLRALGVLNYIAATESQLFCSQLVMQAYQHAGVQVTNADARLISPADILHMREGDVPSVRVYKQLRYVGYLRYEPTTLAVLAE
ncbi:MAG TPA: YiiX/YebB-like N1pC/P60 family cysteine hydrolase [Burkholderiales bacterium]|nr:YiiX/YebB-like N1pC/P60 family cysteine hydrolase [Burkholderiales bacterium]